MSSRKIYKYPFAIHDTVYLPLPSGARILHVDRQAIQPEAELTLWADVDPDAPAEDRVLHVRGTGHPSPPPGSRHIATVLTVYGLVWHVFEAVKEER